MRINHNIMAYNTHLQFTVNSKNKSKSTEKLSSGLAINRAGDDASGLAVSEKMRALLRALDQASRNTGDGINMVQTQEGAMQEIHNLLQRGRELMVLAMNDSNDNPVDRPAIQDELDQIISEIGDISEQTEYNGVKLLNANSGEEDVFNEEIDGFPHGLSGAPTFMERGDAIDGAFSTEEMYALSERKPEERHNIVDLAEIYDGGWDDQGDTIEFNLTYTINVYEMTGTLPDPGDASIAADGTDATFAPTLDDWPSGLVYNGPIESVNTPQADRVDGQIYTTDWYRRESAKYFTLPQVTITSPTGDEWVWDGYYASSPKIGVCDVRAIDGRDGTLTITISGTFKHNPAGEGDPDYNNGQNEVTLPSVDGEWKIDVENAYGDDEARTQRDAEYYRYERRWHDPTPQYPYGRWEAVSTPTLSGAALSSEYPAEFPPEVSQKVILEQVDLKSVTTNLNVKRTLPTDPLWVQGGANEGEGVHVNIYDCRPAAFGLTDKMGNPMVLVHDETGVFSPWGDAGRNKAREGFEIFDNAINQLSGYRAEAGAKQNHLEQIQQNVDNTAVNLASAESSLRDIDMAEEMTQYYTYSVLSQASTAILQEANNMPQSVLNLIG